ncbi:glycerophosphoryl diester phosphodiesterase membrane domain-containing protein [Paenarthrobacter sp. NPDC090520]|uniref:DUF7847 domain-containing protein n=1 Tax=Paenarthrobacter sp. NPDC090520 TaxID=3364382 RepID=UPI00382B59D1
MTQPEHGQPPQAGGQAGWGSQPQWGGQPQWPAPPGHGPWQGQAPNGMPGGQTPPYGPQHGQPYGQHPGQPYGQPLYVAPPKPGVIPLRPLQFGEFLDGAFQTIRRNAASMVGSALIVQAASGILTGVLTVAVLPAMESLQSVNRRADLDDFLGPVIGFIAAIFGVAILAALLGSVLQGVFAVPVLRSVLNRRTGFRQMWKLAARRIWPLLGVAALLTFVGLLAVAAVVGVAVLLVMAMGPAGIALVIPLWIGALVLFVWIGLKLMFAPAAIVVERVGVYDGLLRSWRLTKNSWWRIFGITLVVAIMVGVIGNVVQIPVNLATEGVGTVFSPHPDASSTSSGFLVATIISTIIAVLVGSVTFAFQTSVTALIYVDLRMRREGLDVELMRLMETGADPDGVPGEPLARHAGTQWPPHSGSWPVPGSPAPDAPYGPRPPV